MNKTFHFNNFHFNACVGNNGQVDMAHYSQGYHDAVEILMESVFTQTKSSIDLLVFPILYSARHFLELKLKELIHAIIFINEIIDKGFEDKVNAIHRISDLWKHFERITYFDNRFEDLIKDIEEYIEDFKDIDDNGEAFRYPYSKEDEKYLTNIDCIDLKDFHKRFQELSEKLNDLENLTNYLIEEYHQKSFIANISRATIKRIATKLPAITEWRNKSFSKIKESIKEEFGLSSSKLTKVIDLIKTHREFAMLIAFEIPIEDITASDVVRFFKEYDQYKDNSHKLSYADNLVISIKRITRKFTKKQLAALSQLYEIGYFRLFSEEYERGLILKMQLEKFELIRMYLLNNGIVKDCIIRGLKTIGQTNILSGIKLENHGG